MNAADLQAVCGEKDPDRWRRRWQHRLEAFAGSEPTPGRRALELADPKLVWDFWLPLLSVLESDCHSGKRPLIGLNGPVGAGKSSLALALKELAASIGLRLAVASIDDVYLPWQERQQRLAGNPFGVTRVPPGSHDPELLRRAIEAWRVHGVLVLPHFDKSLRAGQGDRSETRSQSADAMLLEGWLTGCLPVINQPVCKPQESSAGDDSPRFGLSEAEWAWLPRWNRELENYLPLWEQLQQLWILRPLKWSQPRRWRLQAEALQRRRSRISGNSTSVSLSIDELEALVASSLRSLPAELYQDPLMPGATAVAVLDARRRCLWSGPGAKAEQALDQLSLSSAASSIG